MRAARNEDGKTYYVPADMIYREWEKKSIVQKPKIQKNNKITLSKVVNTADKIINASTQQKKPDETKLNDDEEYAINQYISSTAYPLNEKLRKNLSLTEDEENIKINLDKALDKMQNYKVNLTHSVSFLDETQMDEFLKKFEVGKEIQFDEYISTTFGKLYNAEAQVQICIKNAEKGKDISFFNSDEKEVLYKRKSKFVTYKKEKRNGITYIYLKEV